MRREKAWSILIAVGLSAAIAYGCLSCLLTGFQMELNIGQEGLVLFCLLCGVVCAGFWQLRGGGWALLGIGLLVGIYCLSDIRYGTQILLYRITSIYHMAYGWDIPEWGEKPPADACPDGAILAFAVLVVFAVSWVVCRRHRAIWALLPAILPFAACIMVTDTVPSEKALFWLIFGIVLLIVTQTVRRRNGADANRLTAIFLIPCLLMSTLLFCLTPRESYEIGGNPLQNTILQWLQQLPFAPDHEGTGGFSGGVMEGEEVDLSDAGKQEDDDRVVMEVTGARSGLLYLRGQSYDVYTGKTWQISDRIVRDLGWPEDNGEYLGEVQISTKRILDVLYIPYYAAGNILRERLHYGRFDNAAKEKTYTFSQWASRQGSSELRPEMESRCLELPDSTRKVAEKILRQILDDQSLSITKQAETIGSYVRGIAPYSLKTDTMPGSEKDFALWFLEDAQSGYCVHFATAATVLLRAAGIPARYVSGYITYATEDRTTVVTGNQAHAWVEYYTPGAGWQVLEATPGYGLPQKPAEPTPTAPTGTTPPVGTDTQPTDPYLPTPTVGQQRPAESSGTDIFLPTPTADPISTVLLWLLLIPAGLGAVALILWLQFRLRCRIRRTRMCKGTAKRRALIRWKYVLRLCRVLKTQPPEKLLEMAEKAAFSQHKLLPEELHWFDTWIRDAEQAVRKKSFGLLYRLIWAIG